MSGYDIKKALDGSVGNFWSENFGNIYPVLKKLEAAGLVDKRTERSGSSPARHVYTITEAGTEQFVEWLRSEPGDQPLRNEFLLQLFFSHRLGKEAIADKLRAERARSTARAKALDAVLVETIEPARDHPDSLMWLMTLRYGKRMAQAAADWCDDCLALLEDEYRES